MCDSVKRYNIVDMNGNFYKLDKQGHLAFANSSDEATAFSLKEANLRIGTGRKAKFYSLIESSPESMTSCKAQEPSYAAPELEEVKKPTMFDSLDNDWETILSNLCYMSDHMGEYQNNLSQMLSNVDKEICDILHYIELNDLDDQEMLEASKMLKERRCYRREIKDEMEKTALMCDMFLDSSFGIKVQQSLTIMERMKDRYYTPRKLNDLFKAQNEKSTA